MIAVDLRRFPACRITVSDLKARFGNVPFPKRRLQRCDSDLQQAGDEIALHSATMRCNSTDCQTFSLPRPDPRLSGNEARVAVNPPAARKRVRLPSWRPGADDQLLLTERAIEVRKFAFTAGLTPIWLGFGRVSRIARSAASGLVQNRVPNGQRSSGALYSP